MTTCTCKAEHWQPHADACPAKVERMTKDLCMVCEGLCCGEIPRLNAEIARLRSALKVANNNHEHFEREWYLRGDEIERLQRVLNRANDRLWTKHPSETEMDVIRAVAVILGPQTKDSAVEPPAVHRKWPGEPPHCPSCNCGAGAGGACGPEAFDGLHKAGCAALELPHGRRSHCNCGAVKSGEQQ